ncbi:MAG: glycosyltransferase, partial [Miltoncostaeaceae bacterium]
RAAAAAGARAEHTIWVLAPETVPAMGSLLAARRISVGAHGPAEVIRRWLGDARVAIAAATLAARPDARVVVPSRAMIPASAGMLGIAPERILALGHSVSADPDLAGAPAPPVVRDIVLCATRLAEGQRPLTRAAATLASARGAPLVVVGTGPDAAAHRALAARCDPPGRVIEDPAVRPWMRRASVLVGCGLVVLEALAEGCRAVCTDTEGAGAPVRVVDAGNWRRSALDNFMAGERTPEPALLWRALHRQTPAARRALARTVLSEATPGASLDALLGATGADAVPGVPDPAAEALGALLTEIGRANAEAADWLRQVEEARDHHRLQTANYERLLAGEG